MCLDELLDFVVEHWETPGYHALVVCANEMIARNILVVAVPGYLSRKEFTGVVKYDPKTQTFTLHNGGRVQIVAASLDLPFHVAGCAFQRIAIHSGLSTNAEMVDVLLERLRRPTDGPLSAITPAMMTTNGTIISAV